MLQSCPETSFRERIRFLSKDELHFHSDMLFQINHAVQNIQNIGKCQL